MTTEDTVQAGDLEWFLDRMKEMDGNPRDAVAAYLLGVDEAREWVRLDRPLVWLGRPVRSYIDGILGGTA